MLILSTRDVQCICTPCSIGRMLGSPASQLISTAYALASVQMWPCIASVNMWPCIAPYNTDHSCKQETELQGVSAHSRLAPLGGPATTCTIVETLKIMVRKTLFCYEGHRIAGHALQAYLHHIVILPPGACNAGGLARCAVHHLGLGVVILC